MIGGRTVQCDIPGCDKNLEEDQFGTGFPGWGQLSGIALNGIPNPMLCPEHLHKVADAVDALGK